MEESDETAARFLLLFSCSKGCWWQGLKRAAEWFHVWTISKDSWLRGVMRVVYGSCSPFMLSTWLLERYE